ncbi:hypothetical protein [Roseovarius lutimaris]|uniref:hypothetical protein n=1 Tax=Roseovarius lutimaris TaxID=1005928 RepID=UPI000ABA5572|nr:hypothetical protein [Roseovarius lutimaris]
MSKKQSQKTDTKQAQTREDRLKSALKANLARRKAQMRARTDDTPGDRVTGNEDKG